MAAAAPFVKLLRQLSRAKDEYRSGALDLGWDGGSATVYVVFGQPNHAVYQDAVGEKLEGADAISALVHHLPRKFTVSAWRKEVVRVESLHISMEELLAPFAQLAGAASPAEPAPMSAAALDLQAMDESEASKLPFALEGFPLLPVGESLWSDASAKVVHLDVLVPRLPDSLVILTGTKLRAAAIVIRGSIVDAVWVDDEEHAVGEAAAMAMVGATEGQLSGYRLPDARFAEALTLLWRCPTAFRSLPIQWLNGAKFLDAVSQEPGDRVINVTSSKGHGVGLFLRGTFVGAYTDQHRHPSSDVTLLAALLDAADGTATVQQRVVDRPSISLPDAANLHVNVAPSATPAASPEAEPPPDWLVAAEAADADAADERVDVGGPTSPVVEVNHPTVPLSAPLAVDGEAAGSGTSAPPPAPLDGSFVQPPPPAEAYSAPISFTPSTHGDGPLPGPEARDESADGTPDPQSQPRFEHFAALPTAEPGSQGWGGVEPAAPASDANPLSFGTAGFGSAASEPSFTLDESDGNGPPVSTADWGTSDTSPPGFNDNPSEVDSPRLDLDFEGIKADLVQIGIRWLGSDDVVPVEGVIRQTRHRVDDFVSTIEAIKATHVPGHDPSVIRAMAREMHYYAAEALCGA